MADRRFHNFITPVGPLVENIKSTYLNKITTVVHGPVVSKAIPRSTVKVTVPQEAFVDLDAWLSGGAGGGGGGCFVGGLGLQPCPADARLYVALTYEEAGPRFTFFQSSRGHCQIMNILRIYYSPSIMHRYAVVQPLHIEELTFGLIDELKVKANADPEADVLAGRLLHRLKAESVTHTVAEYLEVFSDKFYDEEFFQMHRDELETRVSAFAQSPAYERIVSSGYLSSPN